MSTAVLTASELEIFEFGRGMGMNVHSAEEMAQTLSDLREVQGRALIIGGLAVIHHGYKRYTHDVDILYPDADAAILRRLKKSFKMVLKSKGGWHHLEHRKTKVRLELIPEGGLTTYGFIPGPAIVGGQDGFISLWGLIWLKMVSGRAQDEADVVELMKRRMDDIAALRGKIPPENREAFDRLLVRARQELKDDPNLHPEWGRPPQRVAQPPSAGRQPPSTAGAWGQSATGPSRAQEEAARYGRSKSGVPEHRRGRLCHTRSRSGVPAGRKKGRKAAP